MKFPLTFRSFSFSLVNAGEISCPLDPPLTRGAFLRPGDPLLIRTKHENSVLFVLSLRGPGGAGKLVK